MILLLVLTNSSFSQVDTTRALSFFPLQEGNRWEYLHIRSWWVGPPDTSIIDRLAIGDTLLTIRAENVGKDTTAVQRRYYGIKRHAYATDYFRIDTLNLVVYKYDRWCPEGEIQMFDLNPPSGYGQYNTCNVDVESFTGFKRVGLLADTTSYFRFEMFFGGSQGLDLHEGFGIGSFNAGAVPGSINLDGYWGRVRAATINGQQYGDYITGVRGEPNLPPTEIRLHPNYPNPFNPTTKIPIELIKSQFVRLEIYDNLGRHVKTLSNAFISAGYHEFIWDGKNSGEQSVGSGIYFIRLKTENNFLVQKMMLLR